MTLIEAIAAKARTMSREEIIAELDRLAAQRKRKRKPATALLGDYPIEGDARRIVWPSPVIQVDYADGERVRMSFATLPGKPLNVGRGLRVCAAAYHQRNRKTGKVVRWQVETPDGAVLASGEGTWSVK